MPGLNVEVGRHENYSFEDEYDGNQFVINIIFVSDAFVEGTN